MTSNNIDKFACMDDCIHLKACRRVQAIGRKLRLNVPRYCTEDCTAYQSRDVNTNYISIDAAINYARNGVSSIRGGYGMYDVYCNGDLYGATLGEIFDDISEDEDA